MAVVTGKSYGNEWEMQYFQKTFNKYVLKVGDIDCREPEELLWVEPSVDRRGRYAFSEWKTVFYWEVLTDLLNKCLLHWQSKFLFMTEQFQVF